jgi:tetratricopeptide (TPR) repeat protein/DNA-binding winged helix-turn-helix (wHTH) protein
MKVIARQVYRFEGVEVDASKGSLRLNGEEVNIRQKSLRVLLHLIEQRDRLVTKEELIERAWEGFVVSDDALVQLVKELRERLGDNARQPRFIKTIPKVGYRFIAPVEEHCFQLPPATEVENEPGVEFEIEKESSAQSERVNGNTPGHQLSLLPTFSTSPRRRAILAVGAVILLLAGALAYYFIARTRWSSRQIADVALPQLPGKKTLAVMYFDNRSASMDLDWLREGLADMLITDFSRGQRFTVLSRGHLHLLLERIGHKADDPIRLDEALEIARRSRADVMLLGSFARLDEKMRIEVQLHDTQTGQLLAAESLITDRPAEILNQIDLLSLKLAAQLGAAPTDQASRRGLADVTTHNLEAYRYYSLALEKAQGLHNAEAIALLEKAIVLDPQFAMAYARMGYAYVITWNYPEKAKPYFERAFQLSDHLTEKDKLYITAWYSIANTDFARAAETFRLIIANHPFEVEAYLRLGRLLGDEGHHEEAIAALKQGLTIDPEAQELYNALGNLYSSLGRHDEAIAMHQRYLQLAPDEPNAHDSLGLSYHWAGRHAEALAEYGRALVLKPEFEVGVIHLGNTYFALGRYREAVKQYQRYIHLATFEDERARGFHSLALLYLKKKDWRRAEQSTQQALKYQETSYWSELALALEVGPVRSFEKLNARFPSKSLNTNRGGAGPIRNFHYWRGALNLKLGQTREALEDFQTALSHDPPRWQINSYEDCLADAYLRLGRWEEAIKEYERILRLNPNYPLVHYHLAQAYEGKGLLDKARTSYTLFLQLWRDADEDLLEVIAARERLSGYLNESTQ